MLIEVGDVTSGKEILVVSDHETPKDYKTLGLATWVCLFCRD